MKNNERISREMIFNLMLTAFLTMLNPIGAHALMTHPDNIDFISNTQGLLPTSMGESSPVYMGRSLLCGVRAEILYWARLISESQANTPRSLLSLR